MKSTAPATKSGAFTNAHLRVSAQHVARGGGQGSPGKTVHYNVNGTGRDSYIHANHGGFCGSYAFQNDRDAYVQSLRGYPNTSVITAARSLNTRSPRQSIDHFVEGQGRMSPKGQRGMNELKTYQNSQVKRLAQPKRASLAMQFEDLEAFNRSVGSLKEAGIIGGRADSPRGSFLRKTTQGAAFGMQRSPSLDSPCSPKVGASLQDHLAQQIKSPRGGSPSAAQLGRPRDVASPTGHNLTARSLRNVFDRQPEQQ